MSKIHDAHGVVIYVYPGYHLPPHAHIFCEGRQLKIDLLTGQLLAGLYPPGKKKAIREAFESARTDGLNMWREYNERMY